MKVIIVLCGVSALILQFVLIMADPDGIMDDPEIQEDFRKLNDSIDKLKDESKRLKDLEMSILDAEEMTCIIMTGIDQNVVVQAKKDQAVPADDTKYKEFLSCCWKQYGYQEDDGKINWAQIQVALSKSYPSEIVEKAIRKCKFIKGESPEDTVALVLQCLDRHVPIARKNSY